MAKYYNNKVKTGRVAGSVFAVRFGETIERAYQPVVANPSTPKQVAVRAKMKILSQLAAVMAPVIAMRREGAVSKRNMFTKVNYGAASFDNDKAEIGLANVKLTKSVVPLPGVVVTRDGINLNAHLIGSSSLDVSRVVYACFLRENNNELRFFDSVVVSEPGELNVFSASFNGVASTITAVVYAYGIRDNSEAARTTFGNIEVPSAEMIADLITTSQLLEGDITLTETKAYIVPAAE